MQLELTNRSILSSDSRAQAFTLECQHAGFREYSLPGFWTGRSSLWFTWPFLDRFLWRDRGTQRQRSSHYMEPSFLPTSCSMSSVNFNNTLKCNIINTHASVCTCQETQVRPWLCGSWTSVSTWDWPEDPKNACSRTFSHTSFWKDT